MAKKQVLVKNLEAVESLGAVHVICTDKTGTLTRNELAITSIVDPENGKSITNPSVLRTFLTAALIASEVRPAPGALKATEKGDGADLWSGDPLDVAIAQRYGTMFGSPASIVTETRRHFPFDLAKRREAGVYANDGEVSFAVKGAWESLRPLVGQLNTADVSQRPADDEALSICDAIVHRMSAQGQRMIAVATRRLEALPSLKAPEESLERGLILLGFLALDDPVREEVPAAVDVCRDAGIRVMLITGDHPATAEAVARACHILPGEFPSETSIVLGSELDTLREHQLVERLRRSDCFCPHYTTTEDEDRYCA
ncbi:MAG: HAD family hydrolase [Pirellulales bacterium]